MPGKQPDERRSRHQPGAPGRRQSVPRRSQIRVAEEREPSAAAGHAVLSGGCWGGVSRRHGSLRLPSVRLRPCFVADTTDRQDNFGGFRVAFDL